MAMMMLLSMLLTNCSSTRGNKNQSDGEKAAKTLIDSSDLSKFQISADAVDKAEFIVISLEKVIFMAGWKSKLDLIYNEESKEWNGKYMSESYSIRGGQEKEKPINIDTLAPKSSWHSVIQSLHQNNLLSIRNSEDIDYEEVLADGENYSMTIHIGNKHRSYSMTNPAFYAKEYPEIKDFSDFTSIINLLEEEFVEGLK
jgi:hypothetical protein